MFNQLTQNDINILVEGELGINSLKFIDIVNNIGNNKKLVDIGVETGKSSKILLNNAIEKNNIVYGIDPIPAMGQDILDNPNYKYIPEDSVKIGSEWKNGNVDIIFFDSVHIKPQVMRELYYWWDLLNVGGWAIFHDTNWSWLDSNGNRQYYIHKSTHPCAGKKAGNRAMGCDTYIGRNWETPDYAIKEFFNIPLLNFENDIISCVNGPESLGMTFIHKKQNYDYKNNIKSEFWDMYERDRQSVLKCFT